MKRIFIMLLMIMVLTIDNSVFAEEVARKNLENVSNYISALNKLSQQNSAIHIDTDLNQKLDICQVVIVHISGAYPEDKLKCESTNEHVLKVHRLGSNTFGLYTRDSGESQVIISCGNSISKYNIKVSSNMISKNEARMANGKPLTEENVLNTILSFKDEYPQGMKWAMEKKYMSYGLFAEGFGCAAFGMEISDKIFGYMPQTTTSHSFDHIRVGDIVTYDTENGPNHLVIALSKTDKGIITVEGNYEGRVKWERFIPREDLENHNLLIQSRWPIQN